jgi:5-methylcytosine-specific restriction endonuclease McrA
MKRIYNWNAIQRCYDEGHGFVECQKWFGFSHTAWIKAIKRGKLTVAPSQFKDRRRRYDWREVQAYYDAGNTYRDCALEFGFCAAAWHKARLRGEIKARPLGMPIERLLSVGKGRCNIKLRLMRAGLIENRCQECGLSEWRGKPLSVQIDHINGIGNDYRLENLRMLCPNCHSQTESFGGRNPKRLRKLHELRQAV